MSSASVTANRKPLRADALKAIRAKAWGCGYTRYAKNNRIQADSLRALIKKIREEENV